jgi:RNA polymerase sigma-70 factor, ECF subfamily
LLLYSFRLQARLQGFKDFSLPEPAETFRSESTSKEYMADHDTEIVQRVVRGEAHAYRLLVEGYQDRALSLASRILRNRQEAEELVQDAFVRAYRNLHRFRGDAKFSTWFYRIVYNCCLTALRDRRQAPERVDFEEDVLNHRDDGEDPFASVAEEIETQDLHAIVARELARLPVAYRAVMTLFYQEELSYEEIAEVLGAPLGTVKTNLFRGRDVLRKKVGALLQKEVIAA